MKVEVEAYWIYRVLCFYYIMNREIKFRALKDDISNCNFIYGYLVKDEEGNPYIVEYTSDKGYSHVSCIKGTESEFIGRLDKNGTKIYEDDFVKRIGDDYTGEHIGLVKFIETQFTTIDFDSPLDRECVLSYISEKIEVIGNTHENPDIINTLK